MKFQILDVIMVSEIVQPTLNCAFSLHFCELVEESKLPSFQVVFILFIKIRKIRVSEVRMPLRIKLPLFYFISIGCEAMKFIDNILSLRWHFLIMIPKFRLIIK